LEILTVLGLYSHIFAPIKVKVGIRQRTCGPLPRANFHVYRGNVSPLRDEKPIFGPVSKNNTGMAALCAGLPVTKKTSHFFVYSRQATQDPHHT